MASSFKLIIKGGKTEIEIDGVPITYPLQAVSFQATADGVMATLGIVVPMSNVHIEVDDCTVVVNKTQ